MLPGLTPFYAGRTAALARCRILRCGAPPLHPGLMRRSLSCRWDSFQGSGKLCLRASSCVSFCPSIVPDAPPWPIRRLHVACSERHPPLRCAFEPESGILCRYGDASGDTNPQSGSTTASHHQSMQSLQAVSSAGISSCGTEIPHRRYHC